MRAGATSASQPPIQVNECWSSVVKMFVRALCKLLHEDAENLEIARSMLAGDQKQNYDLEGPNARAGTIMCI